VYEELIKSLKTQIASLELQAEMHAVVRDYFTPRFEACWDDNKRLIDPDTAVALRFYVLDQRSEHNLRLREAQELRDAVDALTNR